MLIGEWVNLALGTKKKKYTKIEELVSRIEKIGEAPFMYSIACIVIF